MCESAVHTCQRIWGGGGSRVEVGCVWEAVGRGGRQGKGGKSGWRSGLCQAGQHTGKLAEEPGSFLEISLRCRSNRFVSAK